MIKELSDSTGSPVYITSKKNEAIFSHCLSNSNYPLLTAKKKPPQLGILVPLQWTPVQNNPSQMPPGTQKKLTSLLSHWTCLWFTIV